MVSRPRRLVFIVILVLNNGFFSEPIDPVPFIDISSPLSDLRWIGHDFIYFLNIPWVEGYSHIPPEATSFEGDFMPIPHDDPRIIHQIHFASMQVLVDFLGESVIDKYVLSRGPSQELVLSADSLARLLLPWGRQLRSSNYNTISLRTLSSKVTSSLKKAIFTLDNVVLAALSIAVMTDPSINSLFLAVGMLLFSLARWASAALGISEPNYVVGNSRMHAEVIMLYKRVLDAGWHSDVGAEVERILGPGIPFLAYAAQSVPTINRSKLVDPKDYIPLHVKPSCTCTFAGPPVADVLKLLGEGQVPVVMFDGGKVTVQDWTAGPYVAISHVWADGLGSITEEGIPTCQLIRLTHLAKQLLPSGAFWLDAICVPGHEDSRKRAIELMAATYQRASQVLVIDAGIRTQCTLASPLEECLIRIATSGWMQRIWTLQEGMLARELHFEFADGLVDCTHFNGTPYYFAQELLPLLTHRPRDDVARVFHAAAGDPPRCGYGDLIPLLRHRRTSKPADEGLAIAALLGIDVVELLAESSAESRMRKLLLLCKAIPRYVPLAGWQAQKLQVPGFKWAPLSITELLWMGSSADSLGPAVCTEQGLLGRYTVVHFAPVHIALFPIIIGLLATVTRDQPSHTEIQQSSPPGEHVISGVHIELSSDTMVRIIQDDLALTFNAVIVTHDDLVNTAAGEMPIAVVFIPSLLEQKSDASVCDCRESEHLRCEFVASGKLYIDPHSAQSLAGRGWEHVDARMHSLLPVLLM
ncbi:hypothetical protein C8R45DRAFT_843422 [Mycena sanguinolenta]|nr:hypothetical protein C8R45DRAFT_843422 [Mycena sanguinolenta]